MKFVIISFLLACAFANNILSLNGEWNVVNKNETVKIVGTVPGSVHMDLINAKLMEDPYYRDNDYKYSWVGLDYWTYSRDFDYTMNIDDDEIYLVAKGLDTVADVYINDQLVGHADNMYRRWWFNIRNVLKNGKNTIVVKFDNSYYYANKLHDESPYDVHDSTSYAPFQDAHRAFIRKTQSDFGWDWGPSFVPVGIYRDIDIITFSKAYIKDISVQTFKEEKTWKLINDVVIQCKSNTQGSVKVTLETGDSNTVDYICGSDNEMIVKVPLSVSQENVKVWFPIGYGEHPLYKLTATVDDSEKSVSIGFRTVEMITDAIPDTDESNFYFKVNDIPVFIKGSNFIPMDAFDTRVSDEKMKLIIDGAVKGNHNSIRIWGGGLYQRDSFYSYCDEQGILIWQEFMFACSLYPRDKQFLENVKQEVIDNIHRLSYHPSIFLWSGNNENQNPAQQNTQTLLDYIQLYDETIRKTLQTIDISRPYWPASPSNGYYVMDLERDLFIQRFGGEGDSKHGDTHRYDYFSLCTDVHTYPKPKFASEFGFHSLPSYYSWKNVIEVEDMDIKSSIITKRDHHMDNNDQIIRQMQNFFPNPKSDDKIELFRNNILQSQIMQGYCIDYEAEHYRRGRNEYHTMGTMYWQLNDIWQAPTWASIEYDNMRWKALHYMMKETYANVLASVYNDGDDMKVYYINDDITNYTNATLTLTVYDWSGNKIKEDIKTFDMEPLSAHQVYSENAESFLTKKVEEALVKYVLCYNNQCLKARYYLPNINKGLFKNIQLSDPHVTIEEAKVISDTEIDYTFSCTSVAAHVWLESEVAGIYSDNAFMCIPNEPVHIRFTAYSPMTEEEQKAELNIRSIYNTYN